MSEIGGLPLYLHLGFACRRRGIAELLILPDLSGSEHVLQKSFELFRATLRVKLIIQQQIATKTVKLLAGLFNRKAQASQ